MEAKEDYQNIYPSYLTHLLLPMQSQDDELPACLFNLMENTIQPPITSIQVRGESEPVTGQPDKSRVERNHSKSTGYDYPPCLTNLNENTIQPPIASIQERGDSEPVTGQPDESRVERNHSKSTGNEYHNNYPADLIKLEQFLPTSSMEPQAIIRPTEEPIREPIQEREEPVTEKANEKPTAQPIARIVDEPYVKFHLKSTEYVMMALTNRRPVLIKS